ncbi:MAG: RimK family alpha-L-glutamate ligase [Lachnospiraceae bacterium]|nr:RimK family alpha-L-glutamate ligase [Lachnospiraceae bacterium]
MLGYLITNKYFISDSFIKVKNDILESAKNHYIDLIAYDNVSFYKTLSSSNFIKPDFVLFWDKDVKLAKLIENKGIRVFNSSESIRICDDKALTYLNLINFDIKMPKTIISPLIYYHDLSNDDEFIEYILSEFEYPFIFKECVGSFGQQVYLINEVEDLKLRIKKCDVWPFIIQEYIKESFGRDLRIYIVGDKVIGSIKRENKTGDFRANIELGGVATPYTPDARQVEMALNAKKALELDFCGVDLLFGKDDEPLLCEVNSNAYFVSFNKTLGLNVADSILDYILNVL